MHSVKLVNMLLVTLLVALPAAADNPYSQIDTSAEAQAVLARVAGTLGTKLHITTVRPVQVQVASASELDSLLGPTNPFRGGESVVEKDGPSGNHEIYVLGGWDQDITGGLLAYGYAMAWSRDNCPAGQSQPLKSAFAQWIAYHYLQAIGASEVANNLVRYIKSDAQADEELQKLFTWQDRLGVQGVVSLVQGVQDLPKAADVAPRGYNSNEEDPQAPPPGYNSDEEDPQAPPPGYSSDEEDPQAPPPGYSSDEEDPQAPPPGYSSDEEDREDPPPGFNSDEEDPENPPPGYGD